LLYHISHELEHKGDLPPYFNLLSSRIILSEGGFRTFQRRLRVDHLGNPIFDWSVVHIIEAIGKDRPHLTLFILVAVLLDGEDTLAEGKVIRNPLMDLLDAKRCGHYGFHLQNENLSMPLLKVPWVIAIEEEPITHDRNLITDLFGFIYPMSDDKNRSLSE
jgi:hypothetical protein